MYVCSAEHYTELNNYVVSSIITGIKIVITISQLYSGVFAHFNK